MIEEQVCAVRDHMLQILLGSTQNIIAQYIAEVITDQFISINRGNSVYSRKIDIEHAALVELPKYLDAGIVGGSIFINSLSPAKRASLGKDFDDLVDAYEELSRIRSNLCKR